MAQKPITMIAGAFGHAEGKTPLNAFDNALLAAGIGNVNLLKISSIVPPNISIIALPRIQPGSIIPMAYASMVSEVPGEIIAAAVAWALPEHREKAGVIMEVHDKATRAEAEGTVVQMLHEAFRARGEAIRELNVFAVEHQVERTGCTVAAVALLAEADIE
jgi:arginine decarboxylase